MLKKIRNKIDLNTEELQQAIIYFTKKFDEYHEYQMLWECRECLSIELEDNMHCFYKSVNNYVGNYCTDHLPSGFEYRWRVHESLDLQKMFVIKQSKFLTENDPHLINFDWYQHCFPLGKTTGKRRNYFEFNMNNKFDKKLFFTKNCFNRNDNFYNIDIRDDAYYVINYKNTEPDIDTVKKKILLLHFYLKKNKVPKCVIIWIIDTFYLEII